MENEEEDKVVKGEVPLVRQDTVEELINPGQGPVVQELDQDPVGQSSEQDQVPQALTGNRPRSGTLAHNRVADSENEESDTDIDDQGLQDEIDHSHEFTPDESGLSPVERRRSDTVHYTTPSSDEESDTDIDDQEDGSPSGIVQGDLDAMQQQDDDQEEGSGTVTPKTVGGNVQFSSEVEVFDGNGGDVVAVGNLGEGHSGYSSPPLDNVVPAVLTPVREEGEDIVQETKGKQTNLPLTPMREDEEGDNVGDGRNSVSTVGSDNDDDSTAGKEDMGNLVKNLSDHMDEEGEENPNNITLIEEEGAHTVAPAYFYDWAGLVDFVTNPAMVGVNNVFNRMGLVYKDAQVSGATVDENGDLNDFNDDDDHRIELPEGLHPNVIAESAGSVSTGWGSNLGAIFTINPANGGVVGDLMDALWNPGGNTVPGEYANTVEENQELDTSVVSLNSVSSGGYNGDQGSELDTSVGSVGSELGTSRSPVGSELGTSRSPVGPSLEYAGNLEVSPSIFTQAINIVTRPVENPAVFAAAAVLLGAMLHEIYKDSIYEGDNG